MAVLNFAHRQLTAKIVYFGPPKAGCNTNVQALWDGLGSDASLEPSRLHRFNAPDGSEQSLYFDVRGDHELDGFGVRYRIYSLPGGIADPVHRREVMRGVDAIVLVADSRPEANAPNEDAMLELEELVGEQGLDLAKLPVVLQVNHLDEPRARGADDVTYALNPFGFPVLEASARDGEGVRETFDAIAALARERIADNLRGGDGAVKLTAIHEPHARTDEDVARDHHAVLHDPATPKAQVTTKNGPQTPAPADEVEVPFQPREFAGSYPVRVIQALVEEGKVFVDVELERMGGGDVRQLRVHLANRPTDAPAVARAPQVSLVSSNPTPSVMGVTDHLPDKVDFKAADHPSDDLHPVTYGIIGVGGGILVGLLTGFLLFA